MSATVFAFPRSQSANAFHEAARAEAEQHNKTIKSFTRPELIQLSLLTQRSIQIGLMTGCKYFEHESGVMAQGFSTRNPAEVVFTLFKDMWQGEAIRYNGFVPLLNEKIVIETRNTLVAFQKLHSALAEACNEFEILYDLPRTTSPRFVQS